jgi:predicted nuclease of predicted toxin-antitoxin system
VRIWLDAQLPPGLCSWLEKEFDVQAEAVRDLGLRDAKDPEIFAAAREGGAVVMSKDADFANLVSRHGPPPQVLWVTCGNTTNEALRVFLSRTLPVAMELIEAGEPLVRLAEGSGPESGRGPS